MDEPNPYQEPGAEAAPPSRFSPLVLRAPRRRPMLRGLMWWLQAWSLFARRPLSWLAAGFLFAVTVVLADWILMQMPLLGGLAPVIVFPVFLAGFLQLAHMLNLGQGLAPGDLFAGFRYRLAPLCGVGALFLALTIVAVLVSFLTGIVLFSVDMAEAALSGQDPSRVAADNTAGTSVLIRAGIWLFTLVLIMMIATVVTWIAPALAFFAEMDPVRAVQVSLGAAVRNILPFMVYGLVVLATSLLVMFAVGLLVFVLELVGVAGAGLGELELTQFDAWSGALGAWLVLLTGIFVLAYLILMIVIALSMYIAFRDIFPEAQVPADPAGTDPASTAAAPAAAWRGPERP